MFEALRVESAQAIAASRAPGIAIGGSLGAEKEQMYEVVGWATAVLPEERPRHLLGIGEVDDLVRGIELGVDTFDCAMPTRLGRHGMALVPDPERRWRVDLAKAKWRMSAEPLMDGCPCAACAQGWTRGYWHYLLRNRELTGQRLLTLHNLAFVQRVDYLGTVERRFAQPTLAVAADPGRVRQPAQAFDRLARPGRPRREVAAQEVRVDAPGLCVLQHLFERRQVAVDVVQGGEHA